MGQVPVAEVFEVTVVRSETVVDLAVSGEIDIETIGRFDRALTAAVLEATGDLNVDLSNVGFMGSVGINALIEHRRLAAQRGVRFRIVGASRRAEYVLELMGLAAYFQ
jgi:anti-anti-sigma factor